MTLSELRAEPVCCILVDVAALQLKTDLRSLLPELAKAPRLCRPKLWGRSLTFGNVQHDALPSQQMQDVVDHGLTSNGNSVCPVPIERIRTRTVYRDKPYNLSDISILHRQWEDHE